MRTDEILARLALHEKSTALLDVMIENYAAYFFSEDERPGRKSSATGMHADVIRHLVECGRMEMVKDDSTWGCCAVWVEEAT